MLSPKTVLVRRGCGYAAVGTAVLEHVSGTVDCRWHLRLFTTAPEVFIPLDDDPASGAQLNPDQDPLLAPLSVNPV